MQLFHKITAYLFLSIYSILMLHGILPHNHHEHEVIQHATELHSHDYKGHNHHHHENSEPSEHKNLLDKALETHSHNSSSNFPTEIVSENNIEINHNYEIVSLFTIFNLLQPAKWIEKPDIYVDPNLSILSHYHLQNLFQRGPPNIA